MNLQTISSFLKEVLRMFGIALGLWSGAFLIVKLLRALNLKKEERYKQKTDVRVLWITTVVTILAFLIGMIVAAINGKFKDYYNDERLIYIFSSIPIVVYIIFKVIRKIYSHFSNKNKLKEKKNEEDNLQIELIPDEYYLDDDDQQIYLIPNYDIYIVHIN